MEKDYNFGVIIDGSSFRLENLQPLSNRNKYNYFCNVSRVGYFNGNGSYDITITDKDFNRGCPVGKWKIVSGKIHYCWVSISSHFVLMDECGRETCEIMAYKQNTPQYQGYDIEALTRAIFSKAIEIVSRFPSSEIYNAYQEFMDYKINEYDIKNYIYNSTKSESIESFFYKSFPKLIGYSDKYNKIHDMLDPDDERSKPLLIEIEDKMYDFLGNILKE